MPTVPLPSKSGGPPGSAVDLADRAHGVQGFAGGAVGHAYGGFDLTQTTAGRLQPLIDALIKHDTAQRLAAL